jgi:hypothetical protein
MEGRAIVTELRGLAVGIDSNHKTSQLQCRKMRLTDQASQAAGEGAGACSRKLSSTCAVATSNVLAYELGLV